MDMPAIKASMIRQRNHQVNDGVRPELSARHAVQEGARKVISGQKMGSVP